MPAGPDSLRELAGRLAPGSRLLGLDVGAKTIGLALSDVTCSVATPLETIRRTKFQKDADALLAILDRFDIGGLVIGLPLNMNGSEGPRAQATRALTGNLAGRPDPRIAFWD